jgi:hypothetical protein
MHNVLQALPFRIFHAFQRQPRLAIGALGLSLLMTLQAAYALFQHGHL